MKTFEKLSFSSGHLYDVHKIIRVRKYLISFFQSLSCFNGCVITAHEICVGELRNCLSKWVGEGEGGEMAVHAPHSEAELCYCLSECRGAYYILKTLSLAKQTLVKKFCHMNQYCPDE